MYDIYLYSGCRSEADLRAIGDMFPFLNDQFFQKIILSTPGFLGLEIEKDEIIQILKILGQYRAKGIYIPSKYRYPQITKDIALEIGERERKKLVQDFPDLTFYQPSTNPRPVLWWEVSIGCKEWIEEGSIPGAIILWIDKFDGHIWKDSEIDDFIDNQPLKRV